jgi:signal transduction histidine kinase
MFGDPHLVERLVVNLLDNALRHNRPNGSLEVMTGGCDGLASLSVANDGPVIRPADIDRLFEPFQRLAPERTGTGEGFGLGLCIVRAVATAQGALLRARVRPQGGLVVDVRFPMTDRGPDDPEAKRRRFSGTRAPAIDRSPGTPVETEGVAALR